MCDNWVCQARESCVRLQCLRCNNSVCQHCVITCAKCKQKVCIPCSRSMMDRCVNCQSRVCRAIGCAVYNVTSQDHEELNEDVDDHTDFCGVCTIICSGCKSPSCIQCFNPCASCQATDVCTRCIARTCILCRDYKNPFEKERCKHICETCSLSMDSAQENVPNQEEAHNETRPFKRAKTSLE